MRTDQKKKKQKQREEKYEKRSTNKGEIMIIHQREQKGDEEKIKYNKEGDEEHEEKDNKKWRGD